MAAESVEVVHEPREVRSEVRRLGLTIDMLDSVRDAWDRAAASATSFEPVTAPGTKGWIAGIGALREQLSVPPFDDWEAVDLRNLPLSLNRSLGIAITATSGDEFTGWLDPQGRRPRTKNPKGLVLSEAIRRNGEQLALLDLKYLRRTDGKPRRVESAPMTYLLLVSLTDVAIMSELSLPSEIAEGEIVAWKQRIILEPIVRDRPPPQAMFDSIDADPIDVPVPRRR